MLPEKTKNISQKFKIIIMKKLTIISALLLGTGLFFTSCLKDICDETRIFIQYEPIYLNENEIRTDISTEAARTLNNPGKIYAYKEHLFINELEERATK